MSTNTKRKSKKKVTGVSIVPTIPMADAVRAFAKSVKKPTNGANSVLDDFLQVMDRLLAHTRSFTIRDVMHHAQYLDLPNAEVRRLFDLWTAKMIQFGKVEQVLSTYDDNLFVLS